MSLAERLTTVTPTRPGLPCAVATVLEKMNDADRETLNDIMFSKRDQKITNPQVFRLIIEEGYKVPLSTVGAHRRRECRCFTGADVQARAEGQK